MVDIIGSDHEDTFARSSRLLRFFNIGNRVSIINRNSEIDTFFVFISLANPYFCHLQKVNFLGQNKCQVSLNEFFELQRSVVPIIAFPYILDVVCILSNCHAFCILIPSTLS